MRRRPALGGRLEPTRKDAETSPDVLLEFNQRLTQQVKLLERENVELQDEKVRLASENKKLLERVALLEQDNSGLRDAGLATLQERQSTVHHAHQALQAKNGEAMLALNTADKQRQRAEALAADLHLQRGINDRLQAERRQMTQTMLGLEATADAMQAEMVQQATAEARSTDLRANLQRHVNALKEERRRLDEVASVRHLIEAQLRSTREEMASEHHNNQRLRDELHAACRDAQCFRSEALDLEQSTKELRAATARLRQAEGAMVCEQPRLCEAVNRESATANLLRGRISELEVLIGGLRRSQTKLEADNSNLRIALTAARDEAHRSVEASALLVAERFTAEVDAEKHSASKLELERRVSAVSEDNSRFREKADELRGEYATLQRRTQAVEAENVMLRGHLKGSQVLAGALRTEVDNLDLSKAGMDGAGTWTNPCNFFQPLPAPGAHMNFEPPKHHNGDAVAMVWS